MDQTQLLDHVAKINFHVMRFAQHEIVTKTMTEFSVIARVIAATNKIASGLHFFRSFLHFGVLLGRFDFNGQNAITD